MEVVAVDVASALSPIGGVDSQPAIDRWINRVNAMPSAGRPTSVGATTGHLLLGLELRGERVINGHRTWSIGASKAAQLDLFEGAGLDVPPSVVIGEPAQASVAASQVGYPVLVKPNVGGSGHGIVRFDQPSDLTEAVAAGSIDLGIDGTGVVQRAIESADGLIHRVEMLGPELFYATDQAARGDVFNYCAADGCAVEAIALVEPDPTIVADAAAVMAAAAADVGGVEYLIDAATGRPCYFDFNPYSNFVSGRDHDLGFDPIDRYLDHVLA